MMTGTSHAIAACLFPILVFVAEGTHRCSECGDGQVSLRCRACYNDMSEDAFCSSCTSEGLNDAGCPLCVAPRCPACTNDPVSLSCRACSNNMTEDGFCSVCMSEGLNDAGCTQCPTPDARATSHCPTCAEDEVSLSCRACSNHMTEEVFCSVCVSEGLNDAGCTRCPEEEVKETQWLGAVEPTTAARSDFSPDARAMSHCPTCVEDEVSLSCRACSNHMTEAVFCSVCVSEGLNDAGCTRCPEDDAKETQQLNAVEPTTAARSGFSLFMICAGVGIVGMYAAARKRRQQQLTVLRELHHYEDMGPVAFHMMA